MDLKGEKGVEWTGRLYWHMYTINNMYKIDN